MNIFNLYNPCVYQHLVHLNNSCMLSWPTGEMHALSLEAVVDEKNEILPEVNFITSCH